VPGKFRERLTFSNVVSVISLLFALGLGSAWAATELKKNEVKSKHIKNGVVKTKDLADNAVTSPKVADGSLLGADFAPGQLPVGATGQRGAQGPQGLQGVEGPEGPAGSPDTPQQVLAKLIQADGAASTVDADTLDGINSLNLARFGGAVFVNGNPAGIGFTSSKTGTGVYRVDFPAGSFKTSTSCKTPSPMVVAHSDTAVIATVAVGMATCSPADGTGGFTARTFTPAGAPVDSAFWFMVL
jgi:hypothetical protein